MPPTILVSGAPPDLQALQWQMLLPVRVIVDRRGSLGGAGAGSSVSASTVVQHVAWDVSTVELSKIDEGSGDVEDPPSSLLSGCLVASSPWLSGAPAAVLVGALYCLFATATTTSPSSMAVLVRLPLLMLLSCASRDSRGLTSDGWDSLLDGAGDCALVSRGASAHLLVGETLILVQMGG
ncbi:hypothetical protein LQW54_012848 [Pestalotiopsis sp. IQ-011]